MNTLALFRASVAGKKRCSSASAFWLILGLVLFAGLSTVRADFIYVSNVDSNTILQFDSSGTSAVLTTNGLNNPTGIAFDRDGNLYVANFGNNTIEKIDASGAVSIFATSGLDGPVGMAFDDEGNLYVANDTGDFTSGSLVEFHTSGGVLTTNATYVLTGLAYPTEVAWDPAINEVFVAQGYSVIGTKGDQPGGGYPVGLVCDSAGILYAANYYFGYINVWDTKTWSWDWFYGEYEITAMAIDSAGNLYAASAYNDNILKYYDQTYYTVFANSGVSWGIALRPATAKPTITLIGGNTVTNECHAPFIDPGATASEGGTDLSSNILVSGTVDANVPGTYTLTYTVVDAFKSSATATRTVIVVDTTPPVITCPANIVVDAVCPKGVFVSFVVTATDECSTATVTSTPPSGTLFAIGDTTVTCTAIDGAGNQSTCSFSVHVKGAPEQIADLIALVQRLNLNPWTTYVLTTELQSASNALCRGNTRAACIDLDTFIFEVDAQTWWGQIWPPSRARTLVRNAQRIQNVLGCGHEFGPVINDASPKPAPPPRAFFYTPFT
jgi:hypothetical protein